MANRVGAPKGSRNSIATEIKPGQRMSPTTEFKKGMTPHNKGRGWHPCASCGKSVKSYRKYCSRYCMNINPEHRAKHRLSLIGRVMPFRGKPRLSRRTGVSGTERHQAMGKIEYRTWRTSVFKRDDYTCQICFVRGGYLEADHIKPWRTHEELRYEVSNGRTLCLKCHRQTETWGRPKKISLILSEA